MNNCLERMESLADMLGIKGDAISREYAELCGYAAGLELVFSSACFNNEQLSPDNATGIALDLYCNMLGIPSELDISEKRELIKERLSCVFGDGSPLKIIDEIHKYNDGCEINDGMITITINANDSGLIGALGNIIENFASPITRIVIENSNYDFDRWDSMDYSFNSYDGLELSYYILDQF